MSPETEPVTKAHAVVLSTKGGTRFVKFFRDKARAQEYAADLNAEFPRGTRYTVTEINIW